MGINSLKGWASVKFIGLAVGLSVFVFSFLAPSVAALSINPPQESSYSSGLVINTENYGLFVASWLHDVIDWGTSTLISGIFEPIVKGIEGFFNEIDLFINAQLEVNGCDYFNAPGAQDKIAGCTTPTDQSNPAAAGFYNAWQSIRDIAYGILVIVALVMVISQALSFEVFDAYTMKKVLPRMLVAAIGISLSWQFIQFMVWVANALGNGITALISTPFNHITLIGGQKMADLLAGLTGLAILQPTLAAIGAVAFLVILILMFIPLFLSVIVIILRQILIVFLAIFAPLAMVCFILPATQSVWKMWWKNFSKALLMFPLIAGALEIGKVFAATSIAGPNPGLTAFLIAMVAYFGPYFLIPKMFKWSGGVLAAAGNMASRAQSGIMKFARNQSLKAVAKQDKKIMSNSAKYANGPGGDLYRRIRTGKISNTKQGKANWEARKQRLIAESTAEKLKHDGGVASGDDISTSLAAEGNVTADQFVERYSQKRAADRAAAESEKTGRPVATIVTDDDRTAARNALATIQTNYDGAINSPAVRLAAQMARDSSSPTAFSADDAGMELLLRENAQAIRDGVAPRDTLIRAIKSNESRPDQSAVSFKLYQDVLDEIVAGKVTPERMKELVQKVRTSASEKAGPAKLLGGHTNGVVALAPTYLKQAQNAFNSGSPEENNRVLATLDNLYVQLSAVSPDMADALVREVLQKPIYEEVDSAGNKTGKVVTVQEAMDDARNRGDFGPYKPTMPPGMGGPVIPGTPGAPGGLGAPPSSSGPGQEEP